ncbi:MAG: (Fe-S)-binding protein [Breznakibacter sp.]|nr:(Fe-S)-binding protein [Breznakibacter sp.]
MEKFSWFVLPFALGFVYLLGWLTVLLFRVWRSMPIDQRRLVFRGLFSVKTIKAVAEIFNEVLLHRKIFAINPLLGWMHFSFAFGWFMLIVLGKIETLLFTGDGMNPVWYPLFFKFFEPGHLHFPLSGVLQQLMDFSLLLILSGQLIAVFKRLLPRKAGIRIKTRHARINQWTLTALWFIFPLRLLAEGVTAGIYGGGGFLTGSLGVLLSGLHVLQQLHPFFWWAYSCALGLFFVMLPYSRYLHIPIEGFLILFKNWGVTNRAVLNKLETLSCSACGLCLDVCPLARCGVAGVQPVYFIERLRGGKLKDEDLWKCLKCLRCAEICPVTVRSEAIRQEIKEQLNRVEYVKPLLKPELMDRRQLSVDVLLFSGCMGRLTPATRRAMERIMEASGQTYHWVDGEADLCCGRPLLLNGKTLQAQQVKEELLARMHQVDFTRVVTTCPICYNMLVGAFPDGVLMHHTQYIKKLVDEKTIRLKAGNTSMVYHDPCELGRGARVTAPPVAVLSLTGKVLPMAESGLSGNCCGGALSALQLTDAERQQVASETYTRLEAASANRVVTACPLCKKTIARQCGTDVWDIAEQVAGALVLTGEKSYYEEAVPLAREGVDC